MSLDHHCLLWTKQTIPLLSGTCPQLRNDPPQKKQRTKHVASDHTVKKNTTCIVWAKTIRLEKKLGYKLLTFLATMLGSTTKLI